MLSKFDTILCTVLFCNSSDSCIINKKKKSQNTNQANTEIADRVVFICFLFFFNFFFIFR